MLSLNLFDGAQLLNISASMSLFGFAFAQGAADNPADVEFSDKAARSVTLFPCSEYLKTGFEQQVPLVNCPF